MSGLAWAVRPLRASARRVNGSDVTPVLRYLRNGYLPSVGLVVALYHTAAHVGYASQPAGPVASKISVRARVTGSVLALEVVDDGIGGAVERDALGIQGLRERFEATGGRFAVRSEPGRGTKIFARIPADAVEPAD